MFNFNDKSDKKTQQEDLENSIDLTRLCLEQYLSVDRVFGKNSDNQQSEKQRKSKLGIA